MLRHLNPDPVTPARVAVVGAGGFVGRAIVKALTGKSVPCTALTREHVDLLSDGAGERLAGLLRPEDTVVTVAAVAPVKNAAMLAENITIMSALAAALTLQSVEHVVNIGSDAVYRDSMEPLTEDSCAEPGSLHGAMHLTREIMLREAVGKTPFASIRPTLIYGADDPHNGYGPNRFRRLAAERKHIVLFGEGEERRDHVHVGDVAELAARVILHRSEGILNAATGRVVSFRQCAEWTAAASSRPVSIETSPRVGPMPHGGYRAFDPRATRSAFPDFRYLMPQEGFARVLHEAQNAC